MHACIHLGCKRRSDHRDLSDLAGSKRAGAVQRGWMRSFVPTSAVEIKDTHDQGSNAQTLLFTVPPSQVTAMVRGMPNLPKTNPSGPLNIFGVLQAGWDDWKSVDGHVVCDEGDLGFLFVHPRNRANGLRKYVAD